MNKVKNIKIDGKKMRDLADSLKEQIPGLGFALIVFEFENGSKVGNYISNLQEDFMIKALENQLESLKKGQTFSTPE
ncbi:hypothetical protein [Mucilaginibacter sp.]|jgi:hypothetical protein|uniref:hypothetical protein n=1 Tax=Mucilaginibacter sp. TaxID=1882438 RepID=UPI00262012E8|nr:hypothetical protein [Mucilaginibacter sp.]MDB4919103.1 hypothetical protein [Mucilaginibacter sp.]